MRQGSCFAYQKTSGGLDGSIPALVSVFRLHSAIMKAMFYRSPQARRLQDPLQ